jgi:hypothetical protein
VIFLDQKKSNKAIIQTFLRKYLRNIYSVNGKNPPMKKQNNSNKKKSVLRGIIKCLQRNECQIIYDPNEGYKITSIPEEKVFQYQNESSDEESKNCSEEEKETTKTNVENTEKETKSNIENIPKIKNPKVEEDIKLSFKSSSNSLDFTVKKTWKPSISCKLIEKHFGTSLSFTFQGINILNFNSFGELGVKTGDEIHCTPKNNITIKFLTLDGEYKLATVKNSISFSKIYKALGYDECLWIGYFDGDKILTHLTVEDYGIEDGDIIDMVIQQKGGKPVILLYPVQTIHCDVSVELSSKWRLTSLYPNQNEHTTQMVEWKNVKAEPNGTLTLESKEYPYLFWESTVVEPMFQFDFNETFCIESETVGDFLDEILTLKGLNFRERCDFITFWLNQLHSKKYVMIQFLNSSFYNEIAKLKISITPDTVIREFFIFQSCDQKNEECKGIFPREIRKRVGFTLVEWGALNMNN